MNNNIFPEQLITDPRILNVYRFGSIVYGSYDYDYDSDEDYIVVADKWFDSMNLNVHVFTVNDFQRLLNNGEIQMLECYFVDPKFVLKQEHTFTLNLDLFKLRTSISTITSNSWVKGKKKLTVMGDYDLRLALKSIFHSLRILDYGIQIASNGKINDYSSMNYVLSDLWKLSKDYHYEELWEKINQKYKKLFNGLSSQFKQLCPKDIQEIAKKDKIKSILENHEVYTVELLNDLLDEYNN